MSSAVSEAKRDLSLRHKIFIDSWILMQLCCTFDQGPSDFLMMRVCLKIFMYPLCVRCEGHVRVSFVCTFGQSYGIAFKTFHIILVSDV